MIEFYTITPTVRQHLESSFIIRFAAKEWELNGNINRYWKPENTKPVKKNKK